MSAYFTAGERVIFAATSAKPEPGTVIYDDPTGFVFVDFGTGRVIPTRRDDLTKETS